ncbi:nitroreductase family deazaflavin-dependent oxidoreductase [Nocardiopsis sp. FIRDI 009]|uniref:nitroreductase family deazaflavin-dependent oxidoreductase n=1 Tax=Nocardiopsis sp. FIRDI 009 TaxID=714197 RepID=UPI000E2567D2|nr:nitroreductase family deazaflavin-dependent oxidoreductase [Nocardiopsis sp. FIRDI 009]
MTISEPPHTPLRRAAFRAPIWLYRLGLGPLLGRRFVLLTHRGRASGEPRQAVLEVVGRDDSTGAVLVAAAYGQRAQWFRNIQAEPRVLFQVGGQRFRGTATPLPPEESGRALAHYAERHPNTARALLKALGREVGERPEDYERVGADPEHGVPIVRLLPERAPGPRFPDFTAP